MYCHNIMSYAGWTSDNLLLKNYDTERAIIQLLFNSNFEFSLFADATLSGTEVLKHLNAVRNSIK